HRLALRARAQAKQRRETPLPVTEPAAPASASPGDEAILDEELSRLPERYRTVLVLCCLQGKSRDEAAQQLGWKPGAVKIRLERARALLRGRLTRRGVTVTAALLAGLQAKSAAANIPAALAATTAQAAPLFATGAGAAPLVSANVVTLALGGLKAMSLV